MRTQEFGHFEEVEISHAASQGDDLYVRRFTPQRHRDLQTVTVRHEQVRDHEVDGSFSKLLNAFMAIGRIHDEVPGFFQYSTKEGTDLIVVVDEEDGARIHCDVFRDVMAGLRADEASAMLSAWTWGADTSERLPDDAARILFR